MSTHPRTEPVALLPPPPDRYDGWTPARQARFLRELAATHCVSAAARAVGMSRQSAYRLRNRLKGQPFDNAWSCAFRRQFDALAEAAVERAIHGVEVPHFYKGQLIHVSRRFDDRAAVALLALRARLTPKPAVRHGEQEFADLDDLEDLSDRVEWGEPRWDPTVGYEDCCEESEEIDDE